mmetsp:Transcript_17366/g.37362  ORF Transcript_17366/g.37362 Transcript_17366/m.37362 type:complete len:212 (+) Transcript_17366:577-1212(+)
MMMCTSRWCPRSCSQTHCAALAPYHPSRRAAASAGGCLSYCLARAGVAAAGWDSLGGCASWRRSSPAAASAPQMRPCLCTACCTADGAGALGSRGGCDRALACGTPRAASPSPESSVSFGLQLSSDASRSCSAYREAKNSRRRSGHFVPHSDEPPWSSHSSGDEDLVDRPSASSVGFLRGEWPVDVEARARHRCDWSTTSPLARKACLLVR